ncbi:hypothetical protein OJ997_32685 [Solirubrobacter phytolaccae]|uniref:WD40 repeat domain-containing protein n=1 Tax=Solirubrobacter phytolaccae TaxID=1404360 RepID=A0A9X3NHE5_9ACTN|nr:hypothetical protein [Solirubrobacter phytolaccae]MDA0185107.1 hypothetical protein [Solirubrobacter phytolaccae]
MRRFLVAVVIATLLTPASASADSILFQREGDIWRMAPDGHGQVQLTSDGEYTWPSSADDGTFVAADAAGNIHPWSADGTRLNVIPVTPADPVDSDWPLTPTHVRISPDGRHVAYDQLLGGHFNTYVTTADAVAPAGVTQADHVAPWWLGNDRLLLSRSLDPTYKFEDLGFVRLPLGGTVEPWFRDADARWASGFTAVPARTGDRIAVYADSAYTGSNVPERTRLRLFDGTKLRCDLRLEAEQIFYASVSPMLSPDGQLLVWSGFDGITLLRLGDLKDCKRISAQIIALPESWEPFWSPYTPPDPGPTLTLGLQARERPSKRSVRRHGVGMRVTVSEPGTIRVRVGGRTVTRRYRDAGKHIVRVHPRRFARHYTVRVTADGAKAVSAVVRPR